MHEYRNSKLIKQNLVNKYGDKKQFQNGIIPYHTNLIGNLVEYRNFHFCAVYKDCIINDYIDEFMKRFYEHNESNERLPRLSVYYKNYLKFFCIAKFRNFWVNSILHNHGNHKAELYYFKNEQKEDQLFKKKGSLTNMVENTLLTHTVKEMINENIITQSDLNLDSQIMNLNNSLTFDESFLAIQECLLSQRTNIEESIAYLIHKFDPENEKQLVMKKNLNNPLRVSVDNKTTKEYTLKSMKDKKEIAILTVDVDENKVNDTVVFIGENEDRKECELVIKPHTVNLENYLKNFKNMLPAEGKTRNVQNRALMDNTLKKSTVKLSVSNQLVNKLDKNVPSFLTKITKNTLCALNSLKSNIGEVKSLFKTHKNISKDASCNIELNKSNEKKIKPTDIRNIKQIKLKTFPDSKNLIITKSNISYSKQKELCDSKPNLKIIENLKLISTNFPCNENMSRNRKQNIFKNDNPTISILKASKNGIDPSSNTQMNYEYMLRRTNCEELQKKIYNKINNSKKFISNLISGKTEIKEFSNPKKEMNITKSLSKSRNEAQKIPCKQLQKSFKTTNKCNMLLSTKVTSIQPKINPRLIKKV